MLKVGDYAQHIATGILGKVVAYGHQMLDSGYQPTLTVRVLKATGLKPGNFLEDLSSAWVRVDVEQPLETQSV